jgi:hypothetical protein
MDERWRQVDTQSWEVQGALYRGFVVQETGREFWVCAVIDSRGQWLRRERFESQTLACAWCMAQLAQLEGGEPAQPGARSEE